MTAAALSLPTIGTTEPTLDLTGLLKRRMQLPQRHRLLHAYPLRAGMPHLDWLPTARQAELLDAAQIRPSGQRGLLIGVLPHPFCNPAVRGCGFCTFPHQSWHRSTARTTVRAVIDEIKARHAANPAIADKPVQGVYFGGGTANLAPVDSLRELSHTLNAYFDLSQAEITLEGAPIYFLKRDRPMTALRSAMDARHFRISMGVQTFDPKQLHRMGRQAFGNAQTFADVVAYAHAEGMTVSGDLLFNLPNQWYQAMRDDVLRAIDIGLDQICLYHLVLFRGLGTEWSKDPDMLAGLPDNAHAAEHWLKLREELLNAGFVQTSLTNFERAPVHATPERFLYEELSFQPDCFDMLGFGPSAISFTADPTFQRGWKLVNTESAPAYQQCIAQRGNAWERFFDYGSRDLRVFYLTRRLAALKVELKDYVHHFGSKAMNDFNLWFRAIMQAGLMNKQAMIMTPTAAGMFYADAMASVLVLAHDITWPRRYSAADHAIARNSVSNDAGYM